MAKVTGYPTAQNATILRRVGAAISRPFGRPSDAPRVVTWDAGATTWQPAPITWYTLGYTDWLDCPDQWTDAAQLWDYIPGEVTNAFIRVHRTQYGAPVGAYAATAAKMQRAAILWQQIGATDRADWNQSAQQLNADAYPPVIDPRTGRPRFATERRWNGFSLFVASLDTTANTAPLAPSDPTRTEAPEMTELLTGNVYEQRMLATLAATDGVLTIAMYQVSPEWSAPGLAASPLFDALRAQPTKRSACRMILGTPTGGTTLATLNDQAAANLTAIGWQVRRVGAYPVLHAKLWLIERAYVYAGSHNLSNRATTSNTEAGILTTSAAVVNKARAFTQGLWNVAV